MKNILIISCFIICITKVFCQSNANEIKRLSMIQNNYPFASPNGKSLVFHSNRLGNVDIYIKDLDSDQIRQLTNNPANDRTPSISPDGKKIAFVSTRDGNYDVFVMNIDGTNQINLTNDIESKDIHPYWSPDGKWIIFNSTNKTKDYDLFIMNPNGKNRTRLRNQSGEATHAQYSPDGTQVIFREFFIEEKGNYNSDIVILNLATKKEIRITKHNGKDEHPIWSKDGKYVVFVSNRDAINTQNTSIYQYNLASKKILKLTSQTPEQFDMTPAFSYDGKLLFFSRWIYDQTTDIFQIQCAE